MLLIVGGGIFLCLILLLCGIDIPTAPPVIAFAIMGILVFIASYFENKEGEKYMYGYTIGELSNNRFGIERTICLEDGNTYFIKKSAILSQKYENIPDDYSGPVKVVVKIGQAYGVHSALHQLLMFKKVPDTVELIFKL